MRTSVLDDSALVSESVLVYCLVWAPYAWRAVHLYNVNDDQVAHGEKLTPSCFLLHSWKPSQVAHTSSLILILWPHISKAHV